MRLYKFIFIKEAAKITSESMHVDS